MRALVIGGNGFIGSHLVDNLIGRGWDVVVFDVYERRYDPMPPQVHFIRGDLNQSYLVREALTGVDIVFHLAWTTIHEISNQDPVADIHANLIPSFHLFDAPRIILDTRLARQELDWRPKVSLKQGLAQTWTWMSSTID